LTTTHLSTPYVISTPGGKIFTHYLRTPLSIWRERYTKLT
jgi:hypothetical protein